VPTVKAAAMAPAVADTGSVGSAVAVSTAATDAAAASGAGARHHHKSKRQPPLPRATLVDLPDEVVLLVLHHLSVADRLAVADVSVGLRAACADDPIYAAIAMAVLGDGSTVSERWMSRQRRVACCYGCQDPSPGPPLIPQKAAAVQGRATLHTLRAVMTLARPWASRTAAEASGTNLLAWADHLLAAHPTGLASRARPGSRGRCRTCKHHGVSADMAVRVWGIPQYALYHPISQFHWYRCTRDGRSERFLNVWAVLRIAFFLTKPLTPKEKVPWDGNQGMPAVLSDLRVRTGRAATLRWLVRERVGGGDGPAVGVPAAAPQRPHFGWWVDAATNRRLEGPVVRFLEGDPRVDAATVTPFLDFLVAVHDGVVDAWPLLARARRCDAHWAGLERHVVWEAVRVANAGTTDAAAVAEAVGHAACVGTRHLCMAWGRHAASRGAGRVCRL